jgi:hypothetical protein
MLDAEGRKNHDNQPKSYHATATAVTGTGVLDCDVGGPGPPASLLNIYAESVGRTDRNFSDHAYLHKNRRRLPTADGPLAIDDRKWHSSYTLRTRFSCLVIYLGQAFVGLHKVQCLRNQC